jgi:hypothetical protein
MPVVLRQQGYTLFFYANEGNPLEAAHIHVRQAGAEAKFWLDPVIQLARNDGFDAATLRKLNQLVHSHRVHLKRAWNDYFT